MKLTIPTVLTTPQALMTTAIVLVTGMCIKAIITIATATPKD